MRYICQMRCEGDKTYAKPDKCPECGMPLTLKTKNMDSEKDNLLKPDLFAHQNN